MSQGENITMLKPHPMEVHYNPADLKATIKQKYLFL